MLFAQETLQTIRPLFQNAFEKNEFGLSDVAFMTGNLPFRIQIKLK